jgi:hypothetical protein
MKDQANKLMGPHPGRVPAPPKITFDGLERQGRDSSTIPQELNEGIHADFEIPLELARPGHTTKHLADKFAFEFVDEGLQLGIEDPAPRAVQETSAADFIKFSKSLYQRHPASLEVSLHAAPTGPSASHAMADTG